MPRNVSKTKPTGSKPDSSLSLKLLNELASGTSQELTPQNLDRILQSLSKVLEQDQDLTPRQLQQEESWLDKGLSLLQEWGPTALNAAKLLLAAI